jgi:uncharacterized protein YecE (DUF72 family)
LNFYIGCSGWSYKGWIGTFYPSFIENKSWLSYYSKYFKFVEVDSTFYKIPSRFVVKEWKYKTPDDFKFALKFPKIITHEKKMHKEFINNAAHELRTPLQPIISLSQLLKDKTKNEEQNSKLLDIIIKKAKRLKKLTEDTLDVTKIEGNTLPK